MSALPVRQAIIARLDELSEDQAAAVLRFIETVQSKYNVAEDDEINDPLVGFISGPTDLAERTEEILWAEFGNKPTEEQE